GNAAPQFLVFNSSGALVYGADGFVAFYRAELSPDGRFLIVTGTVNIGSALQNVVRVVVIDTGRSQDVPYGGQDGPPPVSIAPDGRVVITTASGQVPLPQ